MNASMDPTLIADLEKVEIAAWADFYKAASPASITRCGLKVAESGGVAAVLASAADVLALNRVVGLGLETPVSGDRLDELIAWYTDAGVPRFFLGRSEKQLRRLGRHRGQHLYGWLLEADLDMKGASALPPRLILARLILRLAAPSAPLAAPNRAD